MTQLGLVWRNLFRRRVRSLLTVLGVASAAAMIIACLGLASGFRESFAKMFSTGGGDLVVMDGTAADQLSSRVPESVGEAIARRHVASVSPILFDVVAFQGTSRGKPQLTGVMLFGRRTDDPALRDLEVFDGRPLAAGDRGKVLLGQVLARNLGAEVGRTLSIRGRTVEVVGVYRSRNVFDNGAAVMTLPDLQDLIRRPGEVTGFSVALRDGENGPAQVAEVQQHVERLAAAGDAPFGLVAMQTRDFADSRLHVILADSLAWSLSLVAILLGSLGVMNTMSMSVFERTAEIGLFRAVGWTRRQVMGMILQESVLVTVLGAAVGTGLGCGLIWVLSVAPQSSSYVQPAVPVAVLVKSWVLTLVIGLVAGLYPAFLAARVLPTEAIRHD